MHSQTKTILKSYQPQETALQPPKVNNNEQIKPVTKCCRCHPSKYKKICKTYNPKLIIVNQPDNSHNKAQTQRKRVKKILQQIFISQQKETVNVRRELVRKKPVEQFQTIPIPPKKSVLFLQPPQIEQKQVINVYIEPQPQQSDCLKKLFKKIDRLQGQLNEAIRKLMQKELQIKKPVQPVKQIIKDKKIIVKEIIKPKEIIKKVPYDKIIQKQVIKTIPGPIRYINKYVQKQVQVYDFQQSLQQVQQQVIKYVDIPIQKVVVKEVTVQIPIQKYVYIDKPFQIQQPIYIPKYIQVPVQVPYQKIIQVPYQVPYQVKIQVPYPQRVQIPVQVPYQKSYPVQVNVPYFTQFQIQNKYDIQIPYQVQIPYKVEVPVSIPQRVQYQKIVEKDVGKQYRSKYQMINQQNSNQELIVSLSLQIDQKLMIIEKLMLQNEKKNRQIQELFRKQDLKYDTSFLGYTGNLKTPPYDGYNLLRNIDSDTLGRIYK